MLCGVFVGLPSQQGLRLVRTFPLVTRQRCTRLSSTTIRIKTHHPSTHGTSDVSVRDHLPQQQGLRRSFTAWYAVVRGSTRPSSTTTRIKTTERVAPSNRLYQSTRPSSTTTRIKTWTLCEEQTSPQSTRPTSTTTRVKTRFGVTRVIVVESVRDHRPLQQGLRLLMNCYEFNTCLTYETIVHYNKD